MSLIQINHHPSRRELRQFGAIVFIVLPLLTWWWIGAGGMLGWMLAVGGVTFALSWWKPTWMRMVYLGACYATYPFGWIFGWLALITLYFGLLWPLGWLSRTLGRDRLHLRRQRDLATYWKAKRRPENVVSYYRQS